MKFLKKTMRSLSAVAITAGVLLSPGAMAFNLFGGDTIKVGVLHSLSGTMAISETTLKDTMLMLIEEQNAKGG
ncbi:MAG: transporter substrate-binding protein, partial [Methylococcales bacterium]